MPRDYKQEYKTQHASAKAKKQRAERNRARAKAKKRLGAGAVAGKDIGHTKKGAKGSTKVQTVKANRSHGGRIGNKAGKAAGGRKSKPYSRKR